MLMVPIFRMFYRSGVTPHPYLSCLLSLLIFFVGGSELTAKKYKKKSSVCEMCDHRGLPQVVNTGVTLNQQIASSALTSSATSKGLFIIRKSGRYFLANDLVAAPCTSHVAIVYIDVSDVILDLGGKSITLSTTGNMPSCRAAIELAPGVRNVAIMNGSINGLVQNNAGNTTRIDTGILSTSMNTNLQCDGMSIVSCETAGIALAGLTRLQLSNIQVYGSTNGVDASQYGVVLNDCSQGTCVQSTFCGMLAQSNTYGCYASNCADICFDTIVVSNNYSSQGNAAGMYLDTCTGFVCDKAKASNNNTIADATIAAGFLLSNATDNSFKNCVATNNNCLASVTGSYAYGFGLFSGSHGNNFVACEAKGHRNGDATAISGITAGFGVNGSNSNLFKECIATNNSGCTVAGFYSTNNAVGTEIKSCRSRGNTSSCSVGSVYGILLEDEYCGLVQFCDVAANIHRGFNCFAYGIALLGTCARCIVEYNKILSNQGYQAQHQYGYYDSALDSTTFLRGNVSFGHGHVFSGGANILTKTNMMNYWLSYSEPGILMNVQNLIKEADIANMNTFESGSIDWFNYSVLENAPVV